MAANGIEKVCSSSQEMLYGRQRASRLAVNMLLASHSHPPAQVGVLVVGSGPTGLGAATRLHQLGHPNWLLVDQVRPSSARACQPRLCWLLCVEGVGQFLS